MALAKLVNYGTGFRIIAVHVTNFSADFLLPADNLNRTDCVVAQDSWI